MASCEAAFFNSINKTKVCGFVMKHTNIKMAVFWDVVNCGLAETDVSEVLTASIIRTVCTEQHHTRQPSSYSLL
jgi:hypothetical protein